MTTAIYAFSGDPITFGHINIINRAAKNFDKLIVAIGSNPHKSYLFTVNERTSLAKLALSHLNNVTVTNFNGLLTDFAYEQNAQIIIKGVRNTNDFNYEQDLHNISLSQKLDIDTHVLFAEPTLAHVSSSSVKAVIKEQGDISDYVPLNVKHALESKINKQTLIGITGVCGSGKSYIANILKNTYNYHHIELDHLAHQILNENTEPIYTNLRNEIINFFGEEIRLKDNKINRKILGEIVFNDPKKMTLLNELMRIPLMVLLRKEIKDKQGIIIINAALLAEHNLLHITNNNVLLIDANIDTLKQRLTDRNLTFEQVNSRLASQLDFDQKKNLILKAIEQNHYGKLTIYTNNKQNDELAKTIKHDILNILT